MLGAPRARGAPLVLLVLLLLVLLVGAGCSPMAPILVRTSLTRGAWSAERKLSFEMFSYRVGTVANRFHRFG